MRRELDLPETGFVFCCFNSLYKVTPDVFDVWMRLLARVSGSVLWLLEDNATAVGNLRATAMRHGIAPQRLIFAGRMAPSDHLSRLRAADLFVDTFCYNAHTTASDALWVGLPVLTKLGDTFAGRVAASLLTAIGLPDLITRSPADYEELAVTLATEPSRLTDIKARLGANRLSYPLFDTRRFTRNMEIAYRQMWDIYESGRPPEHFAVTETTQSSGP